MIKTNVTYKLNSSYIDFIKSPEGLDMGLEKELLDVYLTGDPKKFTVEFTGRYGADVDIYYSLIKYCGKLVEATYLEGRDYGDKVKWKRIE